MVDLLETDNLEDSLSMPMFYFMAEVRQSYSHPQFGELDDAVASCWIQRDTEDEAVEAACGWIYGEHWECTRSICQGPIDRFVQLEHLWHLPDGLRYLEQAERDGEAFVFYPVWVGDPPE